jgi:regulator of sigma E protease
MDFIYLVLPFLVVLTVIVFVHEMGHYLVARWNGIAIQTFSIGFGPELWGFNDKAGTRWRLSAVPLGGYVRFVGDMNAASMPDDAAIAQADPELAPRLFINKSVWQRIAVVAAGPIANLILTFVILYGTLVTTDRFYSPPVVQQVLADTPAAAAGLMPGDRILKIDGFTVHGFADVSRFVATAPERTVTMVIERDGMTRTLQAVPRRVVETDARGRTYRVGRLGLSNDIQQEDIFTWRPNPVEAVGATLDEMRFIVDRTAAFMGDFFVGRGDMEQLGGPVKVAQVSEQVARENPFDLIGLVALLSLNIGIFNLLPIPVLDGGHLLFYIYEAIRGRPMSQRMQEIGYRIGLSVVLTLMLFTLFNDTILSYLRSLS